MGLIFGRDERTLFTGISCYAILIVNENDY
jgi:hypothetical protein